MFDCPAFGPYNSWTNASPSPPLLIQPTLHICNWLPSRPIFSSSGHFCLMKSMRMPIALMLRFHNSSRSRSMLVGVEPIMQRQRLAVGQLAKAVAVAVLVAEVVEQRARGRGIVAGWMSSALHVARGIRRHDLRRDAAPGPCRSP